MLSLLVPRQRAAVNQNSYFEPYAQRTKAGVHVNEDIALTFSTVFLCSRAIVEPISGLPILDYERNDLGERKRAKPGAVPAVDVLQFPNEDMTGHSFRECLSLHQLNWTGGFAEIVRDRRGDVVELHPIHPSRVSPGKDGYAYQVRNEAGEKPTDLDRGDMLHICGALSGDGIWSKGVIQHARETIGGALAMDRHAWAYWGSGAQPKGIVISPGLRTPEDKREFRKLWKEVHGSPDSCEVAILPKESDYKPIMISNSDSQFLEGRAFSRKIICEFYRVPTYMIGDRVLGASIEAQAAEFVMNTLYPWIKKWEEQLNLKLLSREQRRTHFFEMDFSAMLRGNVADRMNGYRVALTTGVRTINECRRLENLPGIGPAGDVHYVPANMFTAEQMQHGNPSAMAGPGSDHSGSPADNPLDHEPAMRAFPREQRQEMETQLKAMERQLSDRRTDWREAARVALVDVLGRMLTKEANAAMRIVNAKGDFDSWLNEFYGKHQELLVEAFAPACAVLRIAGAKEFASTSNLAAWHRARSVEALRVAYNSDSRDVFAKRLAAWPVDRAAELTDAILQAA